MSLSEKEAAEVMKHMPVSEVQRLGKAMASLRKVSRGQADSVLPQFTDNVEGDAPTGRPFAHVPEAPADHLARRGEGGEGLSTASSMTSRRDSIPCS